MKNKKRLRKLEKKVNRLWGRIAIIDVEKTEIMATKLLLQRMVALEKRTSDAEKEVVSTKVFLADLVTTINFLKADGQFSKEK